MTVLPKRFIGLVLYEEGSKNKAFVSLVYREKVCNTHNIPGVCSFNDTSVSAKVVIKNLGEGETRTYRCNATYFDSGLITETYTISVTRVQPISGAPQLVESGVGTKDNPIKVIRDTDVTFYLKADPTPVLTNAVFLGKTRLPSNSFETDRGFQKFPENMVRCWPLRFRDLVQCEVDADLMEEGFYSITLENEVDDITIFLQVDPRESEAWTARYAQVQRSLEQEMAAYRGLGEALQDDDDVNHEERELYYHEVDNSHLRPETVPRPAASRHCRAPLTPRLHFPLPPLPSDATRAVTPLRRCLSFPDDYLHPAPGLSNRRAADDSTASRIHRRCSLPSDYLHPVDVVPPRRQSQSFDG
ncbi:hypothetical protein BaRGS_00016647 [Batillaria attramentaria]|uniref:Uncharacterized protein n=1 Tax=Batillaria attramentaria TaxID=370345 RepID=A0ABD0KY18_9CAEN